MAWTVAGPHTAISHGSATRAQSQSQSYHRSADDDQNIRVLFQPSEDYAAFLDISKSKVLGERGKGVRFAERLSRWAFAISSVATVAFGAVYLRGTLRERSTARLARSNTANEETVDATRTQS